MLNEKTHMLVSYKLLNRLREFENSVENIKGLECRGNRGMEGTIQ